MGSEEKIRLQYQTHLKELEDIRDEILKTLNNVGKAFYQKTKFRVSIPEPRIKPIDSVITKIKKRGIITDSLFKQNEDKLELVLNDFIGARVVCNTTDDVTEIKSLILQNRRFTKIKEELKKQESGYRALHLDVLYETHWEDNLLFVPLEIQIKTQLQHAWAEVTHDESYKPENEEMKNEWEKKYSKHMADILDNLDEMACTIRKQRLLYVKVPESYTIKDSDTVINHQTLSFKIDLLRKGERLTQQEMTIVVNRLKQEGFETLAEVSDLLNDEKIEQQIKSFKESLRNNENVNSFEILFYGSLIKRNKVTIFEEQMRTDYGFVEHTCEECNRVLTTDEFNFMNEKTDTDVDYYCKDHVMNHFPNQCSKCGVLTSGVLCTNCEAETNPF